jgi:hypothetical protein
MKTLFNVVFFQALWLVSVGGAGKGYWWIGLPVLAAFCIYHFAVTEWKAADAQLLLIAVVCGFVADSALVQLNLVRFEQAFPWSGFAPVWIISLWAGFALTINHSMAFFQNKLPWAVLFGLLGGPLAYYIAANIWKAVTLTASPYSVYGALALVWAIMTPLLLQIGFNLRKSAASVAR